MKSSLICSILLSFSLTCISSSNQAFSSFSCSDGILICKKKLDGTVIDLEKNPSITYRKANGKKRTINLKRNLNRADISYLMRNFYHSGLLESGIPVKDLSGVDLKDESGRMLIGAPLYARYKGTHSGSLIEHCNPCRSQKSNEMLDLKKECKLTRSKSTIEPHIAYCNQYGGILLSVDTGTGTRSDDMDRFSQRFDAAQRAALQYTANSDSSQKLATSGPSTDVQNSSQQATSKVEQKTDNVKKDEKAPQDTHVAQPNHDEQNAPNASTDQTPKP